METTVQTLATEALKHFEALKRDETDTYKHGDDTPEWVTEMTRDAHNDGYRLVLPDDHRFNFVVEALSALSDMDSDDARDSIEPDTYTAELTAWLHSSRDRSGYVDDAVKEYGLGEETDTDARIGWGQYMEKSEVFSSVLGSLETRLEDIELEDDDTDA